MSVVTLTPKATAAHRTSPTFLVVDPHHFDVSYAINPWMQPKVWDAAPQRFKKASRDAFSDLTQALEAAGAHVEIMTGFPGAPDLVFPANAGVVLDGRAVLSRFRHPQRQVEEEINRVGFEALKARGLVSEVIQLEAGYHEGAGDFIWDPIRSLFWAGFGPRSDLTGTEAMARQFGKPTIQLELATDRFYHLDTCFCVLSGGEILYYPPAFTADALDALRNTVAADLLIEASDADATRFCVNAVCIDRTVIMAKAEDRLRSVLAERGYSPSEVDLAPFILSGGGAYCMTLRLDRKSF